MPPRKLWMEKECFFRQKMRGNITFFLCQGQSVGGKNPSKALNLCESAKRANDFETVWLLRRWKTLVFVCRCPEKNSIPGSSNGFTNKNELNIRNVLKFQGNTKMKTELWKFSMVYRRYIPPPHCAPTVPVSDNIALVIFHYFHVGSILASSLDQKKHPDISTERIIGYADLTPSSPSSRPWKISRKFLMWCLFAVVQRGGETQKKTPTEIMQKLCGHFERQTDFENFELWEKKPIKL